MHQRAVLAQRPPEHQALALAILGDEAEARRDRIDRAPDRQRLPSSSTAPAVLRLTPNKRIEDLAAAGTDQAGHPQHLAGAHLEVNMADVALIGEIVDLEPHRAQGDLRAWEIAP